MKQLLISEIFPPKTGGSGRWFWEIYRRLPREQVMIAAGTCDRDQEFDALHDVPIIRESMTFTNWGVFGLRKWRRYAEAFRRLKQIARRERIDAVHCGRCLPEGLLGWMLSRRLGVPYLCYVHGE